VIKEVQKVLRDNLRFVFRHFPTVQTHPHSLQAATASEAAAAQGKFWQMHDELFTHQTALEHSDLMRYARRIGVDMERFTRDMAGGGILKQIETDYQRSLFDEHVTGTPTLYLNEMLYNGFTDSESLLAAIKQADNKGQIKLPEHPTRLRALFSRLRRD
jgi:protein-disulfide isomerase